MAEGKMGFEQRKHPRADLALDVKYEWLRAGSKHTSRTTDISVGGLRVCCAEPPREQDKLRFFIDGGGGKKIEVDGKVVWVKRAAEMGVESDLEYVFGVQFSDIAERDAFLISQLVEKVLGSERGGRER